MSKSNKPPKSRPDFPLFPQRNAENTDLETVTTVALANLVGLVPNPLRRHDCRLPAESATLYALKCVGFIRLT